MSPVGVVPARSATIAPLSAATGRHLLALVRLPIPQDSAQETLKLDAPRLFNCP